MLLRLFPARIARPVPSARRTRLGFEELGGRYAPATISPPAPAGEQSTQQAPAAADTAQTAQAHLLDVTWEHASGGFVTISGRIEGYVPGMTITARGGPLNNVAVAIDVDTGHFQITFSPSSACVVGIYLSDGSGNQLDADVVSIA